MDMPKLRSLGWGMRLGVACLVLVLGGGFLASALYLQSHYDNRDERAGLTMDDFVGAYHGVENTAPLITALERGHPEDLPESEKQVLLDWLRGDRVSEDYDNLDLGDSAPFEILERNCVSCHSSRSSDPVASTIPLDYFDKVQEVAVSRTIAPTPTDVLMASTHAHATTLAVVVLMVALLASMTCWPRWLVGGLVLVAGAGLLVDMASWWLARDNAIFVWTIVAGGFAFNVATGALIVGILVDVLRPGSK